MTPLVSELADRAEITSLVSRYFSAIDDKRLDRTTMEAVFTASCRLTRTNGASLVGPEAIAAGQSESFARFRATHHVSSDHVIDLDGDSARLRANLIAHAPVGRPGTRSQYATNALPRRRGTPRPRGTHRSGMAPQ